MSNNNNNNNSNSNTNNNRINTTQSGDQYQYLLNTNTSNYLSIDKNVYNEMPKFYNKEIDTKCNSITEFLINYKVKSYDEMNISHIPIVRDDYFKYSIYLETRQSSTFIYSMCFEELFFFDFDDKGFNMNNTNTKTVLDKTQEIIQKMTDYYDSKLNIKLFWILYKTDNGVHAYCLSHKRNRRIEKHMDNIISETVKTCADPDWAAFVKVRFGYCTRISPKLRYKEKNIQQTGGSPYDDGVRPSTSANTPTSCSKKCMTSNIDYSRITNVVINLENSFVIKAPGAVCLFDLVSQLYIKNSLVGKIRDGICQYCEKIGIPLGMFSVHECKSTTNNDDDNQVCNELQNMTECKLSSKCSFKPLIDENKLKGFMLQIRRFHDEIRFIGVYKNNLKATLFKNSNVELSSIVLKGENSLIYNKNYNSNVYSINDKNNIKQINTIKDLYYDSNNETILHKKLRLNSDLEFFSRLIHNLTNETDKKRLLNLPGGEPLYDDILNTTVQCSYTPLMYLIKFGTDSEKIITFIDANKQYIDFNYEINNRYILTALLLVIIESTENTESTNSKKTLFYQDLFYYLIKNKSIQSWFNKNNHNRLLLTISYCISRDYSTDQYYLKKLLIKYGTILSSEKNFEKIHTFIFKYNNENAFKIVPQIIENHQSFQSIIADGFYYNRTFFINYMKIIIDNSNYQIGNIVRNNSVKFQLKLPLILLHIMLFIHTIRSEIQNTQINLKTKIKNDINPITTIMGSGLFFDNTMIIHTINTFNKDKKKQIIEVLFEYIKIVANNQDQDITNQILLYNMTTAISLYKRIKNKPSNKEIEQYIDALIIKVSYSLKVNIRRLLDTHYSIIKPHDRDSAIDIYFDTISMPHNEINKYRFDMSRGIEYDAGGPTKQFFTNLGNEISEKLKTLDIDDNPNPNPDLSYYVNLGKIVARLIYIESYPFNLVIPPHLINMILIYVNIKKELKQEDINQSHILQNITISSILNSNINNIDTVKTMAEYSGDENLEKLVTLFNNKQYTEEEFRQKYITIQKITEFDEKYVTYFEKRKYQFFLFGFNEIYKQIIKKFKNNKNIVYSYQNMMTYIYKQKNIRNITEIKEIKVEDIENNLIIQINYNPVDNPEFIRIFIDAINKLIRDKDIIHSNAKTNAANTNANTNSNNKSNIQALLKSLIMFWTGSEEIKNKISINLISIERLSSQSSPSSQNNTQNSIKNKLFSLNKTDFENFFTYYKKQNNTTKTNINTNTNTNITNKNKQVRDILYRLLIKSHTCGNVLDIYNIETNQNNTIDISNYYYYILKFQYMSGNINADFGLA